MGVEKKYYWIKLKDSFIKSDAVDVLMSMSNGAELTMLYIVLCLVTTSSGGKLQRQVGKMIVRYDVEKIRRECKWFTTATIKAGLALYKNLGLMYEDGEGVLCIANYSDLVGTESASAERKRRQRGQERDVERDNERDNERDIERDNVTQGECDIVTVSECENVTNNVTTEIRDKRLEIRDKRLDIRDKRLDYAADAADAAAAECPFSKIREAYHAFCVSFPKISAIEGTRRKAVAARWRACKSLDVFIEVFKKAEESDFLKGRNARNWSADFDWMMVANNFAKIREGRYSDGAKGEKGDYYAEIEAMEFKRRMGGETIDN